MHLFCNKSYFVLQGWGGEDDDMYNRILEIANFTIYRPPEDYVRYASIV